MPYLRRVAKLADLTDQFDGVAAGAEELSGRLRQAPFS